MELNDKVFNLVAAYTSKAGLFLQNTKNDRVLLRVLFKVSDEKKQVIRLRKLIVGDGLRFTVIADTEDSATTIHYLATSERTEDVPVLAEGLRFGLQTHDHHGALIRLSHPKHGGSTYMITCSARDHVRVAMMAGNDNVAWNWMIDDLYVGQSAEVTIVATDKTDKYPQVNKQRRKSLTRSLQYRH